MQCAPQPPPDVELILPPKGGCSKFGRRLRPLAAECVRAWQAGDTEVVAALVDQVQAEAEAPSPGRRLHEATQRARQVRASEYKSGRSPWDRRATAEGLTPSGWARSAVGRFRKNKESTRARHTRDCVECTMVRHIVQYHVRVVCWVMSSVVPRVAVDSMLGS